LRSRALRVRVATWVNSVRAAAKRDRSGLQPSGLLRDLLPGALPQANMFRAVGAFHWLRQALPRLNCRFEQEKSNDNDDGNDNGNLQPATCNGCSLW
jgi:hypothetical protein